MGVRRAVDLSLEHAVKAQDQILTLGPLIHNNQTVEMLKQRGISTLNEKEELKPNSTILIRAHGVPPETQEFYTNKGHTIIDGTCPKVKTVHKVIARHRDLGYAIIITGDEGHAEVIGLLGYAGKSGYLIQSVEDIDILPELKKICLVSQTTFDRNLFDRIASELRKKFSDSEIIVKKTICSATDERQRETEELAKQVDALIVVGGKNSANTQRLAIIGIDCGKPTQHVETESEINWQKLSNCRTVGITAGASTPIWMIKRVTDYLQFMAQTQKRTLRNFLWHLFDIFANMNIFVAAGSVAMYYVSSFLQGLPFHLFGSSIAFLYFLSMYLWNSLASIETTQHHGISRYRFYSAHRKSLFSLSAAIVTAILIASFTYNESLFYLMFFTCVLGLGYHMPLVPKPLQKFFRYKTLKDIPTSRDLFVALAWATVLTFSPQCLNGTILFKPSSIITFCWIFLVAFFRSLIFDLRDIEGDRIMGRETLITIVGEKKARKATFMMICICIVALLLFPLLIGP
ncbi:MAG: 4-hydroxy-3-methylbut-2-enyl diphosphate reductase, partial [Fibrobacter sp.]|nr:4-hydroxy-3-methylbut-2-enyl diphosphate reductase [Fibrobacter sp.]